MASIILVAGAKALAGTLGLGAFASAALVAGASLVATYIDARIFGKSVKQEGPSLEELRYMKSSTTAPISRISGRFRIGGNVIWATRFREELVTENLDSGSKGGRPSSSVITHQYYVSLAIGLCEGPVYDIRRIWIDGKELADTEVVIRKYYGDHTQQPDPKIVAVEGAANTPAYRGLAYIVFEDLHLEPYGNRIPQIEAEVLVADAASMNRLENRIGCVELSPAGGEFTCGTTNVYTKVDDSRIYKNRHVLNTSDLASSLESLKGLAPNCTQIVLPVAWYGSDLRCTETHVQPKVESADTVTYPYSWVVSGVLRAAADTVSQNSATDKPYLLGTPADRAVFEAIEYIRGAGFDLVLMPMLMLDIPPGNELTDPYDVKPNQAIFPKASLVTISPSVGAVGTPNNTAEARTQIEAFFGTCVPEDFTTYTGHLDDSRGDGFTIEGVALDNSSWYTDPQDDDEPIQRNTVIYEGEPEWSYRRMVLHYAALAASTEAGINGFVIGNGLRNLTSARDDLGNYPAVAELKQLAADVRTVLGSSCTLTYAADFFEWHSLQSNNSQDIAFPLDDLWSDDNIDVVAITYTAPLSDWRNTPDHLDALIAQSIYDLEYLQYNVFGGEYAHWVYLDDDMRLQQQRTPIDQDLYASENWVLHIKDIGSWWSNSHHERAGGLRSISPTSWVPSSKPVWLMSVGAPALNLGTNHPDWKYSSDRAWEDPPPNSNGNRDDYLQRQALKAYLNAWENAGDERNPVGMVALDKICIREWDMRPYLGYTDNIEDWVDSDYKRLGHNLNDRLGLPEVADHIVSTLSHANINAEDIITTNVHGMIAGMGISDPSSLRVLLEPVMFAYLLHFFESAGKLHFTSKGSGPIASIDYNYLVENANGSQQPSGPVTVVRESASGLPNQVSLSFVSDDSSYEPAVAKYYNSAGLHTTVSSSSINLLLDYAYAEDLCSRFMREMYVSRSKLTFKMPPSMLRFDPTDVLDLNVYGRTHTIMIDDVLDAYEREVSAVAYDSEVFNQFTSAAPSTRALHTIAVPNTNIQIMNLPMLTSRDSPAGVYFAAAGRPWGVGTIIRRSLDNSDYLLDTIVSSPSIMGITNFDLPVGIAAIMDNASELHVSVNTVGTLSSVSKMQLLNGRNVGALFHSEQAQWEIVQWQNAEETGASRYKLTGLIRGCLGTEHVIADVLPAGSTFVVLDVNSIKQSSGGTELLGRDVYWEYSIPTFIETDMNVRVIRSTVKGFGYRPYSPCQLKGVRNYDNNDVDLTWIRRTRIGDVWDNSDTPLNEEYERYRVRIYEGVSGDTIIRTAYVADISSYTYTSADQISDWGSHPTTIRFGVSQLSAVFGYGIERIRTITLPT